MDLEDFKACWRADADVVGEPLEEGPVMQMIESRADDLRERARRRLRREASYYAPILALPLVGLLGGATLDRALGAGSAALLIFGAMATLRLAERRIETARLDRTLRDVLETLVSEIDLAGRAYVAFYVGSFVIGAAVLTAFVWRAYGVGTLSAASVALGIFAVIWSLRSGRRYVERMFRQHRSELADCLRQLESTQERPG